MLTVVVFVFAIPILLAGLLYVWLVVGGYFVTKYLVGIL